MGNFKDIFGNLLGGREEPVRVPNLAHVPKLEQTQASGSDLYKKGDVIGGKYEVLGTIGKGGFGVVFLVRDQASHTVWALKTFRPEFLADLGAREAFQREALLWVHLEEHPFILSARVVEAFSGRLFVLMDRVEPDAEGRVSLAHHLCCRNPAHAECQVEWAIQFCLGMEHAKAHGVTCHSDIKPSNILISEGNVKITDFGLAAAAEMALKAGAGQRGLLVTGMPADELGFSLLRTNGRVLCGTPGYMPPEVFRGETADVRSDIYSFGLVLWQIAMGSTSPPFVGRFCEDIKAYMHHAYEQQMSQHMPPLAGPLGFIVERCLRSAPSDRYSDFAEMRGALEPIFQRLTGKSVTIPITSQPPGVFWLHKGVSLGALARHEEAIVCYDKALAIDPQDAYAWNNKGVSLAALGRRDEAIICYERALVIDPQDAKAWMNKGASLYLLRRHEEAVACYERALAIDPQKANAMMNKGVSLCSLGRREEAIACYDKSLAIDPQCSEAWSNKGLSLVALGRTEEAITCYDKALVIDPLDARFWRSKGNSLVALGRHKEAIRYYDKALAIKPQDANAWKNKGRTLLVLTRHHEAYLCFDKALAIDQRDAGAWNGKGFALNALGRREEGIACYDKALLIDPRNADAWSGKGNSLVALGRHEQGITCYDTALVINPLDVTAWFNKGNAEDILGRKSAAARSYAKSLELASAQDAEVIDRTRRRIKELQGR